MTLLARDIMQKHVVTVAPETTLEYLADLLIGNRISGVPVLEEGAVVGIVSRSDFARALSLEHTLAAVAAEVESSGELSPGENPEATPLPAHVVARLEGRTVRDVMVSTPVSVSPESTLHEVAESMVKSHLHRILVVEGKELKGVISALDIVRLVAQQKLTEN